MSYLAPVYRCDQCSLNHDSVIELQQHIMNKHPGVICDTVAFKCTKCGVQFYRGDFYYEHFKVHVEQLAGPAKPTNARKTTVNREGSEMRSKVAGLSSAANAPQPGFGTVSKINVIYPMYCTPVNVISVSLAGTAISSNRLNYHYELNNGNVSTLIGSNGLSSFEWVIQIPS